jgi:sterol desaturase/sphingolipid hydroxylase (fatty acid hydroxylase superfamily)
MKFLVKLFYLPFFLIVGNGLALYFIEQGYSELSLVGLLATFIALAFVLEKAAPYDVEFNSVRGDRSRDVIHAVVNESLSVMGILSVPVIASVISLPSFWPAELPLWQQVIIAVLIADIGITLAHYASHRIKVLWRLHAIHHSVKRLYGFNGLMKHPLHQTIETLAGTTPLLLMGAPQEIFMLLVVAVVLQLLLQHSNVAYFTGPFKYLLAINSVHRFHHLKTAAEGDVNFGLFTQLTDYFLGTRYFDSRRTINSDDLGIATDPDYPVSYVRQLIQPFRDLESFIEGSLLVTSFFIFLPLFHPCCYPVKAGGYHCTVRRNVNPKCSTEQMGAVAAFLVSLWSVVDSNSVYPETVSMVEKTKKRAIIC